MLSYSFLLIQLPVVLIIAYPMIERYLFLQLLHFPPVSYIPLAFLLLQTYNNRRDL